MSISSAEIKKYLLTLFKFITLYQIFLCSCSCLELSICFDKNAPIAQKTQGPLEPIVTNLHTEHGAGKIIFPSIVTNSNRQRTARALPKKALESFQCYHLSNNQVALNSKILLSQKKINHLSKKENLQNPHFKFYLPELVTLNDFSATATKAPYCYLNTLWSYPLLTHLYIKKISGQAYQVHLNEFSHPYQSLDVVIKAYLHKWTVIDNNFGSALIRLD